jgi:hypothetical protein
MEPGLRQLLIAACSALAGNPAPHDPAAVEKRGCPDRRAGAATTTSASRERDDVMADPASCVDDRLATLERLGQAAVIPRGRDRRARN